ncbi:hypothetical protein WME98_28920 [Sorangium sp. So ce296]|uniref:hypothetical protein n=1 Tax=Sorangium sp. So ce296 TaxID=3133296 RepID=UPI003F5D9AA7
MPKLHFKFVLAKHMGFPPPEVFAAVDLNSDNQAQNNEKFDLKQDKLTWTGGIEFASPRKVDRLVVVAAFHARPGVKFTVEVRRDGPEGAILFEGEDVVQKFPEARFLMLKDKT